MRKIHLLFGLLLLFFFACVKENPVDVKVTNDGGKQESHVIAIEQALSDMNQILVPLRGETRAGSGIKNIQPVVYHQSGMTRSSGGADTLLYIVNFENNRGYALLGANDRCAGVIAVVDEGSLSADVFFVPDSVAWDNALPDRHLITTIEKFVPKGNPNGDGGNDYPKTYYGPWRMDIQCDPLLDTKWSQRAPYNNYCPVKDGQRCVAGCVAVATAQILTANKKRYGIGSDWVNNVYKVNWPGVLAKNGDAIAHLVADVGFAVQTNYGVKSSSSSIYFAGNEFVFVGYKNVTVSDNYSLRRVDQMVHEKGLPLMIRGDGHYTDGRRDGHAWVVDGYYRSVRDLYDKDPSVWGNRANIITSQSKDLIHCNFGWGGICDGYYLSGIFDLDKGAEIPDPDTQLTQSIYKYTGIQMLTYDL